MLSPNSLQQLQPRRIPLILGRLREKLYTRLEITLSFSAAEATAEPVQADALANLEFAPVTTMPVLWGRLFYQRWWRVTLSAPAPENTRLHWRDRAEATIYVDGTPWHGIDNPHRRVPLPTGVREFLVESTCVNTGIWEAPFGFDGPGSRFEGAELLRRDDEAWRAALDLEFLYDLFLVEWKKSYPQLDPSKGFGVLPSFHNLNTLLRKLNGHLGRTADAWETGGVPALRSALDAAFAALKAEPWAQRGTLTGHAHIDLVWLWPEKVGEAKAVHTFATQCRLLERYPEFIFGYSQPCSYEAVGRRSPALLDQVRRRIAEGRWEATGALYVESDTQLPCGEGLVRSLLLGQEGFSALRGEPSRVVWLPDVFGYTTCLPQLMRLAGITGFFTTKAAWNAITPFPHTSFIWRGADGSEIVSHVISGGTEGGGGYNGNVRPDQLDIYARHNQQAHVFDDAIMPVGYGDGGGGPTEEMLERARRAADCAGLPRTSWGRIEDFFDRLASVRAELPVHFGEIYLEFHRGVQTTHLHLKSAYRAAERALQTQEAAHCLAAAGPISQAAWKRLVFGQFHDCIPGSSFQEVYDEYMPELRALTTAALAASCAALGRVPAFVANAAPTPARFNPLPLPRHEVVELPDGPALIALPPLSRQPLASARRTPAQPVATEITRLANARLTATFDAVGRIASLMVDGVTVAFTGAANELYLLPDNPAAFDAWDIDRPGLSLGKRADDHPAHATIEKADPLRGVLAFTRRLTERSQVTIRYTLDADSPVLRIRYDLDWHEPRTLLKAAFPTAYRGRDARYGTPYGSILRSQQPARPQDEAAYEVPASRWAVIQDDAGEGLAIISESTYGFGAENGLFHVSLVHSPRYTGGGDDAAMRDLTPTHEFTDLGAHTLELALGLHHPTAPRHEQPAALADLLFTPTLAATGPALDCGLLALEGGESLVPAWAQPEGNHMWTLRLHETLGRRGFTRIHLAPGLIAEATDLLGQPFPDLYDPATATLTFRPYQIISLRICSATTASP